MNGEGAEVGGRGYPTSLGRGERSSMGELWQESGGNIKDHFWIVVKQPGRRRIYVDFFIYMLVISININSSACVV